MKSKNDMNLDNAFGKMTKLQVLLNKMGENPEYFIDRDAFDMKPQHMHTLTITKNTFMEKNKWS